MATAPRMTLRVSRDSGRTWTARRDIRDDDCTPSTSSAWPPCQCPQHRLSEEKRAAAFVDRHFPAVAAFLAAERTKETNR